MDALDGDRHDHDRCGVCCAWASEYDSAGKCGCGWVAGRNERARGQAMTMAGVLMQASFWKSAGMIATIVITSSAGEVLTAAAMKSMGDLDVIRAKSGLGGAIKAVVTSPLFMGGIFFMAVAFFSLLVALNH